MTIIEAAAASADGSRFVSAHNLLSAFIDVLSKRRIEPLITSVSASNVVFAIDSRDLRHGGRDLIEAISGYGTAIAQPNQAIVSLVGEGLRSDPRLVSRVFKAIDEIELGAILQGSSPITMSFVVG